MDRDLLIAKIERRRCPLCPEQRPLFCFNYLISKSFQKFQIGSQPNKMMLRCCWSQMSRIHKKTWFHFNFDKICTWLDDAPSRVTQVMASVCFPSWQLYLAPSLLSHNFPTLFCSINLNCKCNWMAISCILQSSIIWAPWRIVSVLSHSRETDNAVFNKNYIQDSEQTEKACR